MCKIIVAIGSEVTPHHTFFRIENLYILTGYLVTHNVTLKFSKNKKKKKKKDFEYDVMLFNEIIRYQHFLQEIWLLLVLVTLQTLVLFFLCFSAFCEFQCLNIYYGNILLHFGLVGVKIYEI